MEVMAETFRRKRKKKFLHLRLLLLISIFLIWNHEVIDAMDGGVKDDSFDKYNENESQCKQNLDVPKEDSAVGALADGSTDSQPIIAVEALLDVQEEKFVSDAHGSANEFLRSFRTFPTKGQPLMLVRQDSPYRLILSENVAYKLQQSQRIINAAKDSEMEDVPFSTINDDSQPRFLASELTNAVLLQASRPNATAFKQQLQVETFKTDDMVSSVPLTLQSHPGYGIVPLSDEPISGGFMFLEQENYVRLGLGSAKHALRIVLQPPEEQFRETRDILGREVPGRKYVLQVSSPSSNTSHKTESIMRVSASLNEGSPITVESWALSDDAVSNNLLLAQHFSDPSCHFIINSDGTIAPAESVGETKLVIGVSPYPMVTLVPRSSPRRLLFRYAEQFWSAPAPEDGVPLELKSHPGLAVVALVTRPYKVASLMQIQELGIGPIKDAVRLFSLDNEVHHQFKLMANTSEYAGMTMVPLNLRLGRGIPVRLVRYNSTIPVKNRWMVKLLSLVVDSSKNSTWIVNLEGSISPVNARYLVLGCEFLSPMILDLPEYEKLPNVRSDEVEKDDLDLLRYLHLLVHFFQTKKVAVNHVVFFLLLSIVSILKLIPLVVWVVVLSYVFFGAEKAVATAVYAVVFVFAFKRLKKWLSLWREQARRPQR